MTEISNKPESLPPCIFCNKECGSEEHIWPAWIHRYRKFGLLKMQEGTGPEIIADNPEQTVNTVCHTCNNTWMSQLEQKNIPSLKPMVDGKLIVPLSPTSRSKWAMVRSR